MNVLRWFLTNPIAVHLLTFSLLIGGCVGVYSVKKEWYPARQSNIVSINVAYEGASAKQLDELVVVRIENALQDLEGVFQTRAQASYGLAKVSIELEQYSNPARLLTEIKTRVDAIRDFPLQAERPVIELHRHRDTLLWIAIVGSTDYKSLKSLAYQLRDDLSQVNGVSSVAMRGLVEDELSIEVSEKNLRKYALSFEDIAKAIRESSVSYAMGRVEGQTNTIQLNMPSLAKTELEFADIVVGETQDRGRVFLRDVADIKRGLESDKELIFSLNGQRGLNLQVLFDNRVDLFEATRNVESYLASKAPRVPGVDIKVNSKRKDVFTSRIRLLVENAFLGILLVYLVLSLFLSVALANWVIIGVLTAFAGVFAVLPLLDVSVNMLSTFAFILVIGIVVDDAIIVGENYYKCAQREGASSAAITALKGVSKPLVLGVISMIAFFMPLLGVPQELAPYTNSIFYVVLLCLLFSLLEALCILPTHLREQLKSGAGGTPLSWVAKTQAFFSSSLFHLRDNYYCAWLESIMGRKSLVLALFFGLALITASILTSGLLKTSFFPNVPKDFIVLKMSFPDGSSAKRVVDYAERLSQSVLHMNETESIVAKNAGRPFVREVNYTVEDRDLRVFVGLTRAEHRQLPLDEFVDLLRASIHPLPKLKRFSIEDSAMKTSEAIVLNISSSVEALADQKIMVERVAQALSEFKGIRNIQNTLETEARQVSFQLKPHAATMNVSALDVSKYVARTYHGEEVQRIPAKHEDVRVMLRYPIERRESLDSLDSIYIETSMGNKVHLGDVANFTTQTVAATVNRVDGKRTLQLRAEVEDGVDALAVVDTLIRDNLISWRAEFPGFSIRRDGDLQTQARFGRNFSQHFIIVFALVFCLFAVALKSLIQPPLIMMVVPFACIGALGGHLLLGYHISMMSFFGLLACSGVVINNNLVLLERCNQLVNTGEPPEQAIKQACKDRFRATLLTSITTFIGLLPIMFERSFQAQFLKPMVISLAFGVLVSTFVTLFFMPVIYTCALELKSKCLGFFKNTVPPVGA